MMWCKLIQQIIISIFIKKITGELLELAYATNGRNTQESNAKKVAKKNPKNYDLWIFLN